MAGTTPIAACLPMANPNRDICPCAARPFFPKLSLMILALSAPAYPHRTGTSPSSNAAPGDKGDGAPNGFLPTQEWRNATRPVRVQTEEIGNSKPNTLGNASAMMHTSTPRRTNVAMAGSSLERIFTNGEASVYRVLGGGA